MEGFLVFILIGAGVVYLLAPRSRGRRYRQKTRIRNPSVVRKAKHNARTTSAQHARVQAARRLAERPKHAPPPPIPSSMKLVGKAWVIDGDTIAIKRIKICLAGIDAPELDEPWGQKSKWAMMSICKGKTIHVALTGETSYDRLVGTCYLPDGTDIGAELIKVGLALDGSYYSKGKYLHLEPEGIRRKLGSYGLKQHR